MQLQRVSYRVGSSGDEFVLLIPKSRFMGNPKVSFETYVLNNLGNTDVESHEKILEYHPKSVARRLQLSDINQNGNVMEFRIKLGSKFSLDLASVANDDPYFYGDKLVTYPDGSCHLHVELVSEDNKHVSPSKGAAPIYFVPGSVSVPSECDKKSVGSRMDVSVSSKYSFRRSVASKSVRSSKSNRTSRSSRSSKTTPTPIINTGGSSIGNRASKYRRGANGEREEVKDSDTL